MLKDIKDKSIKEEGERMVPAFHKGALVYGEHLVRYESIEPLINNKVVLDIAAGSGYGTYLIAQSAKKVYGVEVDKDSIKYAKKNYHKSNIEYKTGEAEKIPLDDSSVEVVVSFETIEHVSDYEKFLDEIKRVLVSSGTAIISTPNDPEFSEHNQFHLHEFQYAELKGLLGKYFKNVKLMYQYSWLYSGLLKEDENSSEWSKQITTNNYAPAPNNKALYFVAVCSDSEITTEPLSLGALAERYRPKDQEELVKSKEHAEKLVGELRNKVAAKDEELSDIYHSKGWRLLSIFYTLESFIFSLFRRK